VWSKPIHPIGSWAVAVWNRATSGGPLLISVTMTDLQLSLATEDEYHVTSVLPKKYLGIFNSNESISFRVNPNGVYLFKAIIADFIADQCQFE